MAVKGSEDTWMNLAPPGTFKMTPSVGKLDELKAQP